MILPGQYYDQETGLHYNYFRYYDPETGRYITSDPIGLEGGLNAYLYADANPLVNTDRYGLRPERQILPPSLEYSPPSKDIPPFVPSWICEVECEVKGGCHCPKHGVRGVGVAMSQSKALDMAFTFLYNWRGPAGCRIDFTSCERACGLQSQ